MGAFFFAAMPFCWHALLASHDAADRRSRRLHVKVVAGHCLTVHKCLQTAERPRDEKDALPQGALS